MEGQRNLGGETERNSGQMSETDGREETGEGADGKIYTEVFLITGENIDGYLRTEKLPQDEKYASSEKRMETEEAALWE